MKLLGAIFFALFFIQCATLKLEENPPFTIKGATYSNWVGGMPGSGGIDITFYYEANSTVVFDSIYFKGRKTKVQLRKDRKGTNLFGKFYRKTKNSNDLQLNKNTTKEYGNEPPKKEDELPFELKENEAIITYKEEGKIKYYKVENIKKGKRIMMQ